MAKLQTIQSLEIHAKNKQVSDDVHHVHTFQYKAYWDWQTPSCWFATQ